MARDQIRYDLLTQDALRQVIRRVLGDAARDGLPGEHHFYISFRTTDPGVRLSPRMRSSYPDEMTIILQHQFWDLQVTDQSFEVGLAFGGVPERLLVPYGAITGFFDPSVEFGVKFESGTENGAEGDAESHSGPAVAAVPGPGAEIMSIADAARDSEAPAEPETPPAANEPANEPTGGGEVVRLDAFRKKT
jgi:uncharacterized protein